MNKIFLSETLFTFPLSNKSHPSITTIKCFINLIMPTYNLYWRGNKHFSLFFIEQYRLKKYMSFIRPKLKPCQNPILNKNKANFTTITYGKSSFWRDRKIAVSCEIILYFFFYIQTMYHTHASINVCLLLFLCKISQIITSTLLIHVKHSFVERV